MYKLSRWVHLGCLALLSAFACTFAFAAAAGCIRPNSTPLTEVHARASLDVLREVVDPAYELAVQGCKDRQARVVEDGERDGGLSVAQIDTQLAAIRARCHKVRTAFDELRTYHDEASRFVEDGRIEDAEQEITKAREAWRTLAERVEQR